MRLSLRNDAFPMVPHEVAVGLTAQLGFDAAELLLAGNGPRVPLEDIRRDINGWAARLDERIRGRGLEVSDVLVVPSTDFEVLAPNHPGSGERNASLSLFRDMLDLIERLGCSGLTMLPGVDWPAEPHEASLARAGAELAQRATEARARNLRFSIEPHVGSVCQTPDDVLTLCDLAPGLELTLDPGNFLALGCSEAELDPLLAHTRHLHARSAAPGRLQTRLTENTINYERIIDDLTAIGYDGYVLVEYLWAEQDTRLCKLDIVSEVVLLRDRLRAKLRGHAWEYPKSTWAIELDESLPDEAE
jgi:sugar phosphate isomerase/epimerase